MRFLPLFLDLSSGTIALVGNSPAAINKLHLLRSAGASVRWFSDDEDASAELLTAGGSGRVEIDTSRASDIDASQFAAVVIAYGDKRDDAIAGRIRAAGGLINVVDRPDLSNFIFPAIVDRGDVVVAIGTNGASPVLARRIREQIEALLPARLGDLAALMGRYRERFAKARHASRSLRRFWEHVVDGPIGAAALAGRWREAETALARAVEDSRSPEAPSGVVFLVGAGPGDPDLLTLRALHTLQNADVIFYDDLVTQEILARARRDAELVFVGKRKGEPGIGQDAINRRLIEAARTGKQVVRLKGGDPFIFGRGGEELEQLRQAGVSAFVVPGITAALGCAAEVGLPLTFRQEATQLTFITANTADGAEAVDWSAASNPHTTVAVYMGLSAAGTVRDRLIAAGRDPKTPVAVLVRGTRPDAKALVGRLDELPTLAVAAGSGPALLVIGEVVARSEPWRASLSRQEVEVAA